MELKTSECEKYVGCFWDDAAMTTNGFDSVVDHANKTHELASNVIGIVSSRLEVDSEYCKGLRKCTKQFRKLEKSGKTDLVVNKINAGFQLECQAREAAIEKFNSSVMEPFRESFKKEVDVVRKSKNECLAVIKSRKSHYESAIKACKLLTSKVKSHEAMIKKGSPSGSVADEEKFNNKLHKDLAQVRLAEKDARTGTKQLTQVLIEYEAAFTIFCQQVEFFDRFVNYEMEKVLEQCNKFAVDLSSSILALVSDYSKFPEECETEARLNKFVNTSSTNSKFYKYAKLTEVRTNDKLEYTVVFSDDFQVSEAVYTPTEYSFKSSLNSDSNHPELTISTLSVEQNNSKTVSTLRESSVGEPPVVPPAPPLPSADESNESKDAVVAAGTRLVTLYAYQARNEDELSFEVGQEITVVSQEDESWYVGRLSDGTTGVFPLVYAARK